MPRILSMTDSSAARNFVAHLALQAVLVGPRHRAVRLAAAPPLQQIDEYEQPSQTPH